MPPSDEIGERPARHVRRAELALAGLARQLGEVVGDVDEALLVDVADDRHHEPLRRVGREAEVVVALEHELVALERRVELRERAAAPATSALSSSATIVTLTPDLAISSFVRLRNASSSVMSASSLCVTCGMVTQLRCSTGPLMRLIRDSATRSTSPNFSKSTFGQGSTSRPPTAAPFDGAAALAGAPFDAASTSPLRIRPLRPRALHRARSTPSSRARRRAPGPAYRTSVGGAGVGVRRARPRSRPRPPRPPRPRARRATRPPRPRRSRPRPPRGSRCPPTRCRRPRPSAPGPRPPAGRGRPSSPCRTPA